MSKVLAIEEETEGAEIFPWKEYQHFIGGEWVDSTSDERITTVSPATEEPLGTIPVGTAEDVDRAVAATQTLNEFTNTKSVFFDRTGLAIKPRY
jgi:hypothetical protein